MIAFVLGSLCEVIGKLELLGFKDKANVQKGYIERVILHSNRWNYNE
jgi:hypothetical protein